MPSGYQDYTSLAMEVMSLALQKLSPISCLMLFLLDPVLQQIKSNQSVFIDRYKIHVSKHNQ